MTYQTRSWTKEVFLLFVAIILTFQASANDENSNPWSEITEREFAKKGMNRQIIPQKYQTFKLDMAALQVLLNEAPLRFSAATENQEVVLHLPMPNGEMGRYKIFDAPIMEPALAAQYPMIHSYAGVGIDDPTASLRFDVTPFGFHGLILSARHSSVYIDPYSKADTEHYIAYYKNDFEKNNNDFACHLKTEITGDDNINIDSGSDVFGLSQGDCQLRTYRLALSCTGEYAQFHNGTNTTVIAAMNTTMTRVNGIFERDINATMVMVNGNENLIFLDAGTDPYDNASAGQLIDECHTQCNNIIGAANYDIGHVFSTGGGGLAGLGVVCNTNNKGRGVTGTSNPVGDPFDVDYVAHEMGHQFGANHTFNNSCSDNRNSSTAVEPGSGSSIMAYAGICAPNVQFNSDDYFHAMSIEEMSNYINSGNGNSCATLTNTGNNAPTADAGANYVLPIGTPFKLTATGGDTDGDAVTFCWEQMDHEIANMPPEATNTSGPAFRSFAPTEDNFRYFPKLSDLVNGVNSDWAELPGVSRNMNFRVTVRDNHNGSGCTQEDDMSLTFTADAGPFVVQSPNTTTSWFGGATQTITWDVADTDMAPVSCANVDVLLSTDGGYTYSTTIASGVPNSGSVSVSVPNVGSTTCRVMVVCSDNIFFDISDENFTIEEASAPTFVMNIDPSVQDVCGSIGSVAYQLDLTSLAGFNETVTLTVLGTPTNAVANFSENNFVPTAGSALTISNLENVPDGLYNIFVVAESNSVTLEQNLTLVVNNTLPDEVVLNEPFNGATEQSLEVELAWGELSNATSYQVEIATSPSFGNSVVETVALENNTFTPQNLEVFTVYYWRVSSFNNCGENDNPTWFSFQTGGADCTVFESIDTPVNISANEASTITSTININHDLTITNIQPTIDISHTWVGDLKASLTGPTGTSIVLFDQVGVPATQYGCDGDDLLLTFDDFSNNDPWVLESSCGNGNHALEGVYEPIDPLSDFFNQSANGDWILTVEDVVADDGGALNTWSLEVCYDQEAEGFTSYLNNTLTVQAGTSQVISNNYLQATSTSFDPLEVKFVVLELPLNGTLFINGIEVVMGTAFSQNDINTGHISYLNTNTSATEDEFVFDVSSVEGAWLQEETFNIIIENAVIVATAFEEQAISCHGENDGMIFVSATGQNPPFTYSLNGGVYQSNSLFENLSAGLYNVEVKDSLGNVIATNSVTLENPEALNASAAVDDHTVTVNADGGTGTLSYSLVGGAPQSSNIFENMDVGVYDFVVTDENGCSVTIEDVEVSPAPIIAEVFVEKDLDCFGDSNGVIFISASGGVAPLEYSLNGGTFQEPNFFENLPAGTYTIEVKDSNGNIFTANSITLENPEAITAAAQVDNNTIIIGANGGTGTLSYSLVGGTPQSSNIFEDMNIGFYDVIVTDENGCSVTIEEIEVSTLPITATVIIESEIHCFDDNDGMIFVSASGGVAPLEYSLNGGTFQVDALFENLPAGTYSVEVKDANGNIFTTNEVILENPDQLNVDLEVAGNVVTILATGGTGDLMYNINGSNFSGNNIFTDLPNGQYTFVIVDENDCQTQVGATVNIVENVEVTTTDVLCHNEASGIITVDSVMGGPAPFLYSLDGNNFSSSTQFTNLAPGNYNVYVMDVNGFVVNTGAYQINNTANLSITALVTDNHITATGLGGTGVLMYSINGVDFQESNIFENLPNGIYVVTVMDENGCTKTTDEMIIDITALNDLDFEISFEIFPNPNIGQFTIELNQPTEQNLNLQIFDVTGKLVREIQFEKNQTYLKEAVDVTNLAAGSYEVLLTDGKMFGRKRFVKM